MPTTVATVAHRLTQGFELIALSVLAVSCGTGAQPVGGGAVPPFRVVATTHDVMDAIVVPASDAIFDAVVYSNGELEQVPETGEDWSRLRLQALAVAEGANLLLVPQRAMGRQDWIAFSGSMADEALAVARAAEAKDVMRVLETGAALYGACLACHEQYVPED